MTNSERFSHKGAMPTISVNSGKFRRSP